MFDVPTKDNVTGTLAAAEWNGVFLDLKNALVTRGITLTDVDLDQFSDAILSNALTGDFYEDNGSSGSAYIVRTPVTHDTLDAS